MIPRVRGTNFVPAEEEQLTRSWLHVIQTPSPKGEALWDRVEAHYNAHAKAQRRSHRSLSTKWGIIQHDLSAFVRALALEKQQFLGEAVQTEDGSGPTEVGNAGSIALSASLAPLSPAQENELIAKALVRYSESSVNQHSQFAYLHVWRILKDVPQWQDHLDRRMSLEAPAAASAAAAAASAAVMGPIEPKTKRAKRQAERISSSVGRGSASELKPDVATSDLSAPLTAAARAFMASSPSRAHADDANVLLATAALKKAEALELQAQVALFATPMDSLEDDDAKEFFRYARAEALAKLKRRRPSE